MDKLIKLFLIIIFSISVFSCGKNNEPDEPDVNHVNSSLDNTFAKLNGEHSASWAESLNDVTYVMTFTPYDNPKNQDIRISDGGNVNFTKRARIFGRVNVVMSYSFSSGNTSEQYNKEYLYGIETTVGEPYEIVFYPYSSIGDEDIIYGISYSYYIKNINSNSFVLSMNGKTGDFHLFKK